MKIVLRVEPENDEETICGSSLLDRLYPILKDVKIDEIECSWETLGQIRKTQDASGEYLWKPTHEFRGGSTLLGIPLFEIGRRRV